MKLTSEELVLIENALLTFEGELSETLLDNLLRKVRYLLED